MQADTFVNYKDTKYFRIDDPGQNLRRTKAQLALFEDMMRRMNDMRSIIQTIASDT